MAVTLDHYKGCLAGLAVGDAIGTTVEFRPPGSFAPVKDMMGGGVFGLKPGEWTDDTSMALCLAESLIAMKGFDPLDQMIRYRRWMREGYMSSTGECFDIGNATREALLRFEKTGEGFCGLTNRMRQETAPSCDWRRSRCIMLSIRWQRFIMPRRAPKRHI